MNANKYILPVVLCLWCSLVASGASAIGRHEMNIGDFESLEVIDNVNVDYYCNADSAGKFVLYCTAEQANGFILSNNILFEAFVNINEFLLVVRGKLVNWNSGL